MINFSTELANNLTVRRFMKECPERFIDIAERAINKAASKIRQMTKKEVPKAWGIEREELKDFKIKRASRKRGELVALAILRGIKRGKYMNIPLFKFTSVSPRGLMTGKTTGGVTVMLAGQNVKFEHAFIAKMNSSGHIGVFERTGEKTKNGNNRITELTTAAVTGLAASEKTKVPAKIAPIIQKEFEEQFIKEAGEWLQMVGSK